MMNFQVNFALPWLLLLLIPAAFFTLLPYFRLAKKYRRTRNRIISITLHLCIMVMSILVLSGMTFDYDKYNYENEVMLVVDCSDSNRDSVSQRNEFIRSVVSGGDNRFKIGVVTFGYDAVYASELSRDGDAVYSSYIKSLTEKPVNGSGTDIASALIYAKNLLANPQTAKIVLISDGVQTDGDALTAVKRLAAEGVRVSTVSCETVMHDEVQLVDMLLPDYSITQDEQFTIGLTVQSSYEGSATVTLYDNNVVAQTMNIVLTGGLQTVPVTHALATANLHELRFEISSEGDTLMRNNGYYGYMYLYEFKDVLILESFEGEGAALKDILVNDYNYLVDIVNIKANPELVPATLTELRNRYQQVVLVNISNADLVDPAMPENFTFTLNNFVKVAGGGVFAVGGCEPETANSDNPIAHAFNREDMRQDSAAAFRDMLPVTVDTYKPPLGVVIIIDRSGSMNSTATGGKTLLGLAKESAKASLNALTYRDYVGIITLESSYSVDMEMTSMLNRPKIEAAIDAINIGGNTLFRPALERAYQSLVALGDRVQKKHIIVISDGQPQDDIDDPVDGNLPFGPLVKEHYDNYGITVSVVAIDTYTASSGSGGILPCVQELAGENYGHGNYYPLNRGNAADIVDQMRSDLIVPELTEVKYEQYTPRIAQHTSVVRNVKEDQMPSLGGFFGVRVKDGAITSLEAPYAPLYTQWNYGKGKVGAFLCSLDGSAWSEEFITLAAGKTIIGNIVSGLMPIGDIKEPDIKTVMSDGNYSTRLNIITKLEDGEGLEITVTSPSDVAGAQDVVQTFTPTVTGGQTRVTFDIGGTGIKKEGLHKVTVRKLGPSGEELSRFETYKVFSYSAEYDVFIDRDGAAAFMEELASSSGGAAIPLSEEGVGGVFKDFAVYIHKTVDPRLFMAILSIFLFLLDVAVRKFKFKWPHEIVRDYKENKELMRNKR